MTISATLYVSNHHHPAVEKTDARPAMFAVVSTHILKLERGACEHRLGLCEVQTTGSKGVEALGWIVGDAHWLLYIRIV